jgi:hypothetical protein
LKKKKKNSVVVALTASWLPAGGEREMNKRKGFSNPNQSK